MYYVAETNKTFDQAALDLESAIKRHSFVILHVHDLGFTLRSKGIAFDEQCRIFAMCNPGRTAKALSFDMRLNMVLPCRISVFTDAGKKKIGFPKPVEILSAFSQNVLMLQVAKEVEETSIKIIDEAK